MRRKKFNAEEEKKKSHMILAFKIFGGQ